MLQEELKKADIIVSTALIPCMPAPVLITEDAVKDMHEGAVIVDMAAATGGNCPLTEADRIVIKHGVILCGVTNFPALMPSDASNFFARNLYNFLMLMLEKTDGAWHFRLVRRRDHHHDPHHAPGQGTLRNHQEVQKDKGRVNMSEPMIVLYIFVLACFIGYWVIWGVTPSLHTPLISLTNAISGIIIVGAILVTGYDGSPLTETIGFIAVLLASINIFGGFVVTQRMLAMFKKKRDR
jgi:NAD(P) transhydrogenase subunit alpha